MLIRNLIQNNDFDLECNYKIYDCTNDDVDWNNAELLYSSMHDDCSQKILDMKIKYITFDVEAKYLIIEATRNSQ